LAASKKRHKSLGALLSAHLDDLGWNKKVGAERCGILYPTFVAYTNEEIEQPPPETLVALSKGLRIDIRELMAVTGYAPLLEGFRPE
jgi:hypothetical protein